MNDDKGATNTSEAELKIDSTINYYPASGIDSTGQSHLGLAVGVLVTVIVMLIVAIVFILYKNYQYDRHKQCLSTSDSPDHWSDYSGKAQTTQPGGLICSTSTSEEVYPLYPAYHNSTVVSTMSTSHTNHYAAADLLYYSQTKYGRDKAQGV